MRRYLVILFTVLLSLVGALFTPSWSQTSVTEMNTTGVDFWVTFMTNNGKSTQKPADLPTINLSLMAVADEGVTINVDGPSGSRIGTITIPAGGGSGTLNKIAPSAAYIDPSNGETVASKGIHVYAQDGKTKFSCYALSEVGQNDGTTRDATLLIPTEYLDKEYFVQTYPDAGGTSTEFVVVATEDNTEVVIVPQAPTANGIPAGTPVTILLSKGQVYLVPSAATGSNVNMSGSKVCADKPVAVFQGNEATKIPTSGANSPSHPFEQTMPISMWGSEFYFGLTEHATRNYFYITAAYDNTVVTVSRSTMAPVNFTLGAGQSISSPLFIVKDATRDISDVSITSTKPIMCYTYLSSGALNAESIFDPVTLEEIAYYTWGNPTNAMLASWSMRSKTVSFYTDTVSNQTPEGVQKMYVQVVTKTADKDKLSLDGVAVDESLFKTMAADNSMSYANIELTTVGKHTLTTTGDGFVGFVYSITSEARAFQYTLGFNPRPYRDSLFIANTDNIMSPHSYDLQRLSQGWYQRQLEEWPIGKERLDTAYVCDSTTLNFFGQLSNPNINDSVVWKIYHCDAQGQRIEPAIAAQTSTTIGTLEHLYDYQFILDPQKDLLPHERTPFEYFAVDMEKYHKHVICTDLNADADTLRTMVRVNRQYNDTILRRVVCVTDKVQCYKDDASHTTVSASSQPTTFMSRDKLPTPLTPFVDGFDVGYNIYQRHYQTVNGCDSIMSFELWVCDTVRIILDTTICENEPLKFDGSLYFQNEGFLNSGTYLDTVKTHECDALKSIDPTFQGCDSIFQVNLTICPIYRDTMSVTYCSHGDWTLPYKWYRKGVETPSEFIMDISVAEEEQGEIKYYSDTLKTTTCPDCYNHGCDSIFVLKLKIAPYYKKTETNVYCGQSYAPELNAAGQYIGYGSLVNTDYTWTNHETHTIWDENNQTQISAAEIKNMALGTTNTFIDSLTNASGCDSIFVLNLTRNKGFLGKDSYTTPNNEPYTWHNIVYGPYEDWNDTIIYLRDPAATTTVDGCDSVWILELQISQSFKRTDYHTICDDSLFVWEGHESRITVPRLPAGHYTFPDSLKMIRQGIECDSIWILDLTVNPTYKRFDTLYICDTDSFSWEHRDYKNLPLGLFEDSVHYSSAHTCDSAVYLAVYTHKTYSFTETAVVCQDSNFVWEHHEGHALIDENGDPVVLSTAVDGEYTYIDHLYTTDCPQCNTIHHGCDSVYTLTLKVNSSYIDPRIIVVKDTICSMDVPYIWTGHTYKDGSQMEFSTSTVIRDTISTIGCNCDSIVELQLHVVPNAPQFIERTVCQTVAPFTLGAQQLYFNPADSASGSYVSTAVINVAAGCSYTETITIHVDSAYTNLTEQQMTCQAEGMSVTWRGQEIDISEAGTFTRVDSLHTTCCNCDSITTFTLTVFPSYYPDSAADMSDEMIIHWDGCTYVGENAYVSPGTIVEAVISHDTIIVHEHPVVHHGPTGNLICDSTTTLRIRYGEIYRDTIEGRTCANVPFEWIGKDQYGGDSTRMIIPVSGLKDDSLYADRHRTVLDFDSIYFLRLHVDPYYPVASERTKVDSICQGETYVWEEHVGKSYTIQRVGDYVFYDSLTSVHSCDSVWKLELRVDSIYHITDSRVLCDNDTLVWEHRLFVGVNYAGQYDASEYHRVHASLTVASTNAAFCDTTYDSHHKCDSTHVLNLTVRPTYLQVAPADTIYRHICGDASGRELETQMISTALGCDSLMATVTYIHQRWLLSSNDTTTCQNSSFTWPNHEGHLLYCPERQEYYTDIPTDVAETLTFIDSLQTLTCPDCPDGGCDSVWTLRLTVTPTHLKTHRMSMSDEETYFWEHTLYIGEKVHPDTISDPLFHGETEHKIVVAPTGTNVYDTLYHTEIYGCDSIEQLTLRVGPTYRDTLHNQHTCINEPYIWHRSGELTDRTITPTESMIGLMSYFSDTLLTKEFGFDSISILELIVHPTYTMPADYDTVCKNANYTWHRKSVRTDTEGWITVYDSLKTKTCPDCQAGIGCDSVHTLHLYVAPTYYYNEPRVMCDNLTLLWQRRLYVGAHYDLTTYGAPEPATADYDQVIYLSDRSSYLDTARYQTVLGCDSNFHLELTINHSEFYLLRDKISDNNKTWSFGHGYNYHRGTDYNYYNLSDTTRVPYSVLLIDTVKTAEGCDIIYHDSLTVYPEYRFLLDTFTCSNESFNWRRYNELNHRGSGYYYDSLKTKAGFDSVYVLYLNVIPGFEATHNREFCKNDTIYWQQKKLYWDPFDGDLMVSYKAQYERGGGCDSVYYLNAWYKNYYHYDVKRDTCCRFDDYHWYEPDGSEHTLALRGEHGESFTSIPTDTVGLLVLYDSLHTSASCRCDSTFTLELFVKPAYHFYESHEPVCTGTTVEWRGQTYTSDVARVITDDRSFKTTGDCDSVFHFTVEFYQSYDYETEYFEVCADHGHFEWHEISFDEELQRSLNEHHTADDTIVRAKIYNTILGCDSTYHIQLVIHPVLWEEWDDTICIGESYDFNGRILKEASTYYDTVYTEFGCPAYQVLNLSTQPATRFNLVADSACADYGQYILRVGYEGLRPDSFAVFYDSLAHAHGFIDVPKDTFASDNVELALPQTTPFLRPDNYTATLFFFTRHCKEDSTMLNRFTLQVRYPSSILRQMWNDAIAIYDSAYNGGYRFEKFQWYRNSDRMPGQEAHFLYQPHWLDNGEQYSVALTRVGEDYSIMTCPLTVTWDNNDKVTPTMQYLSVVPTMVSRDYPVTNILSLIEGDYKVINPTGSTILSGRIVPDEHHAMYINLPAVSGLYVVEMSDDEGNSRTVKVMVY